MTRPSGPPCRMSCVARSRQTTFQRIVDRWRDATQEHLTGDPVQVVEVTAKRFGLTEPERRSVLQHLVEGGDLSRYGLANALTRASQDVDRL